MSKNKILMLTPDSISAAGVDSLRKDFREKWPEFAALLDTYKARLLEVEDKLNECVITITSFEPMPDYEWKFLKLPEGSNGTLSNDPTEWEFSTEWTFTPRQYGTYTNCTPDGALKFITTTSTDPWANLFDDGETETSPGTGTGASTWNEEVNIPDLSIDVDVAPENDGRGSLPAEDRTKFPWHNGKDCYHCDKPANGYTADKIPLCNDCFDKRTDDE